MIMLLKNNPILQVPVNQKSIINAALLRFTITITASFPHLRRTRMSVGKLVSFLVVNIPVASNVLKPFYITKTNTYLFLFQAYYRMIFSNGFVVLLMRRMGNFSLGRGFLSLGI